MTSKLVLYLILVAIAGVVILLTYTGLFASPLVIIAILVLYVVVSLLNRRKFARQKTKEK